jgi:hypothetical protein
MSGGGPWYCDLYATQRAAYNRTRMTITDDKYNDCLPI